MEHIHKIFCGNQAGGPLGKIVFSGSMDGHAVYTVGRLPPGPAQGAFKLPDPLLQGGIVKRLCRSAFSLSWGGLLVLVLFQFPDKVPDNFNLLSAVSAGFVWRVDNNFLYKLIDDSRR